MTGKNKLYIECPVCGCMTSLRYDVDRQVYVSKCPNCGLLLEMEKEEYERDSEDIREIYFKENF